MALLAACTSDPTPGAGPPPSKEAPDSDATAYEFIETDPKTGIPARFRPCEPIHYRVNPSGGPPDALAAVEEAARLTSDATGISFVFDGVSADRPNADSPSPNQLSDPVVLVAWSPRGRIKDDPSDKTGDTATELGVTIFARPRAVNGYLVISSAEIVINTEGLATREMPSTMLHEFGHLVGLAHVANERQIMSPEHYRSALPKWGKGDLAGLKKLGSAAGCP